jgi:hypothetical protein
MKKPIKAMDCHGFTILAVTGNGGSLRFTCDDELVSASLFLYPEKNL